MRRSGSAVGVRGGDDDKRSLSKGDMENPPKRRSSAGIGGGGKRGGAITPAIVIDNSSQHPNNVDCSSVDDV